MIKTSGIKLISYLAKIDYRKEIIKKVNNLEERIKKIEEKLKSKSEYNESLNKYLDDERKKNVEKIKKLNS